MTAKDFEITENKDLENNQKNVAKEERPAQLATEASKIKNAHAAGDGSYGRSDDSVSENSEEEGNGSSADNNY